LVSDRYKITPAPGVNFLRSNVPGINHELRQKFDAMARLPALTPALV
jgi:hypothetical protein